MRRSSLGWDISWVLAVKLALLAILFTLFFAPSKRPVIDAASVSRHLLNNTEGTAP